MNILTRISLISYQNYVIIFNYRFLHTLDYPTFVEYTSHLNFPLRDAKSGMITVECNLTKVVA